MLLVIVFKFWFYANPLKDQAQVLQPLDVATMGICQLNVISTRLTAGKVAKLKLIFIFFLILGTLRHRLFPRLNSDKSNSTLKCLKCNK